MERPHLERPERTNDMKNLRNTMNRKGGAGIKIAILAVVMIALFFGYTYFKMNWKRFQADFSFGFTMVIAVVVILLFLFLIIKHKLKKLKKERAEKKAAREVEKAAEKAMKEAEKAAREAAKEAEKAARDDD